MVYNLVSTLPNGDGQASDEPHCQNCASRSRRRQQCTGQVILTSALLTRYKQQIIHPSASAEQRVLRSMEPVDVVAFLHEHLDWRVTDNEGHEVVDKSRVALKVAVAVGEGRHYADESRPSEYSNYKILYGITEDAESGTGAKPEDGLFPNNPEYRP